MRHYELVTILSPMLSQDQATEAWGQINDFITNRNGDIFQEQPWGTRRLAYPIHQGAHHFLEGNYRLTRFSTETPFNQALESFLKFDERVLRSLVLTIPGRDILPDPVAARPAPAAAAVATAATDATETAETPEAAVSTEGAEATETPEAAAPTGEETQAEAAPTEAAPAESNGSRSRGSGRGSNRGSGRGSNRRGRTGSPGRRSGRDSHGRGGNARRGSRSSCGRSSLTRGFCRRRTVRGIGRFG